MLQACWNCSGLCSARCGWRPRPGRAPPREPSAPAAAGSAATTTKWQRLEQRDNVFWVLVRWLTSEWRRHLVFVGPLVARERLRRRRRTAPSAAESGQQEQLAHDGDDHHLGGRAPGPQAPGEGAEGAGRRAWPRAGGSGRRPAGPGYGAARSPDGRLLASGRGDGTARLRETGSGRLRAALEGYTDQARRPGRGWQDTVPPHPGSCRQVSADGRGATRQRPIRASSLATSGRRCPGSRLSAGPSSDDRCWVVVTTSMSAPPARARTYAPPQPGRHRAVRAVSVTCPGGWCDAAVAVVVVAAASARRR